MRCRAFPERVGPRILLLESVACENIRFSTLFAAGDVSRGGTSAIASHASVFREARISPSPQTPAQPRTTFLSHCYIRVVSDQSTVLN